MAWYVPGQSRRLSLTLLLLCCACYRICNEDAFWPPVSPPCARTVFPFLSHSRSTVRLFVPTTTLTAALYFLFRFVVSVPLLLPLLLLPTRNR